MRTAIQLFLGTIGGGGVGFPVGCLLSLSYFYIFDPDLFDAPGGGFVILAAGVACVVLGSTVGFVAALGVTIKRSRPDNAKAFLAGAIVFYYIVALLLMTPFFHGIYQSLSRNRFSITHGPYNVRLAYVEPSPTPTPVPTPEPAPPAGTQSREGLYILDNNAKFRDGRIYVSERILQTNDFGTKKTPLFTVTDSEAEITCNSYRPDDKEMPQSVASEFKVQLYTASGVLVAEEPKSGKMPRRGYYGRMIVRRSGQYYLLIRSNLRWIIYIDNYRLARN